MRFSGGKYFHVTSLLSYYNFAPVHPFQGWREDGRERGKKEGRQGGRVVIGPW